MKEEINCKCHCHQCKCDIVYDCSDLNNCPHCQSPTPDKLAEAEKRIERFKNSFHEDTKGVDLYYSYSQDDLKEYIEELLAAASLISYEKGREEQRKVDLELARKVAADDTAYFNAFHRGYWKFWQKLEKLLNPSPDAK